MDDAIADEYYLLDESKPSTHALHTLRSMKNAIIGSQTAKHQLIKEGAVPQIVEWLNGEDPDQAVLIKTRIEAAHVVSSLAHGHSDNALELYQCRAFQAIIHALAHLQPGDPLILKEAMCRALQAVGMAYASVFDEGFWGLGKNYSYRVRQEFRVAMSEVFKVEVLDIILPLLGDSSPCMISAARLLAAAIDRPVYAAAVSEWCPPADRAERQESRVKRGWEKPDISASQPHKAAGWVAGLLLKVLATRNDKVVEAALLALSALCIENTSVANAFVRPLVEPDSTPPLDLVLTLSNSRCNKVRVAACLCAARILRSRTSTLAVFRNTLIVIDPSLSLIVILNKAIADRDIPDNVKADFCFILSYLVSDHRDLQTAASNANSLSVLLDVIKGRERHTSSPLWDEVEAECASRLKEAAFTALASLTLHLDPLRRKLLDMTPPFMGLLVASLTDSHVGVRYAGCQCARALSRSVEVVRTSSVDSGLGFKLFDAMKLETDLRVKNVTVMAMSNLVLDFSPIRENLLEAGIVKILVELCDNDEDEQLKVSALWAIKNMLYRSERHTEAIITELGWDRFSRLLMSTHSKIQEQAVAMVQNIVTEAREAEFLSKGLGEDFLFDSIRRALDAYEDDTVYRAAWALLNLSSSLPRRMVASKTGLMVSLREKLAHRNYDMKRVALNIILRLAEDGHPTVKLMRAAGIEEVLKERVGDYLPPAEEDVRLRDDLRKALNYFRDM